MEITCTVHAVIIEQMSIEIDIVYLKEPERFLDFYYQEQVQ